MDDQSNFQSGGSTSTIGWLAQVVLLCVAVSALSFLTPPSIAQKTQTPEVQIISHDERFTGAAHLTVDPWGTVHVFYSAWLGQDLGAGETEDNNTVMYTSNRNDEWSLPVDILVPMNTPDTGVIVNSVAYMPSTDELVVLWRSDGKLFLSQAPVEQANDARNWRTQVLFTGSSYWGAMTIDTTGTIHVVYDSDFSDLYHMQSTDGGETWSAPQLVVTVPADTVAYAGTRLIADRNNHLHLVWEETSQETNWNAVAVWYARSINNGATWTTFEVARSNAGEPSTGGINVGLGAGDEIHLVWNRGAGTPAGRYYRWSTDGGASWSEKQIIWPDDPGIRGGQAGWGFPLLDGDGKLHLVAAVEDQEASAQGVSSGLRYASWTGNGWSQSVHLTTCEFPDATVSQGDLIHVVCPTFDGTEQIKYIQFTTDAAHISPVTKPTEPATAVLQRNETPIPALTEPITGPIRTATATLTPNLAVSDSLQPQRTPNIQPIVLSTVCALLIVIPFSLWRIRKR